jgi:UDP-N-acetylmuramoyl-tripeptide--D-alanyl-D-alanine ligase
MSALWTAAEAAAATGGRVAGEWQATGLSIDSRSVAPGDLFVALSAARDGHDFVADALAKGAAAALVARVPEGVDPARLLIVADVMAGLTALARAARARTQAKVIAVTGSVGKTTVKEMLRAALAPQGATHAAEASFNNHWGVPVTLARMPADTRFAVIEIGMNAPGEIAPLARLAAPDVAVVTTVAPAHLEAFGVIEGIAREKASIYEGLAPGGVALAHADIETAPILFAAARARGARLIRFGEGHGAGQGEALEARLADLHLRAETAAGQVEILGAAHRFEIGAPGRHYAMNALIALTGAAALGADVAAAAEALKGWTPFAGRGTRERLEIGGLRLEMIDDAFNANPASVAAALEVLAAAQTTGPETGPEAGAASGAAGRRVAVLGDMLELGAEAPRLHAALADLPAMARIDRVHTVGPLMAHLHTALPASLRGLHRDNADDMAADLIAELRAGDVLLIKGSKGIKTGRVVDALRKLGQASVDDS